MGLWKISKSSLFYIILLKYSNSQYLSEPFQVLSALSFTYENKWTFENFAEIEDHLELGMFHYKNRWN